MALGPNDADVTCPLDESILNAGLVFELIGAALVLYQLEQQYDLWEEDIENLQTLAECYEEIGTKYKTARLALRANDAPVYAFQNNLPSYPGPCLERVTQARLNGLLQIGDQQKQALKSTPAWACGDACDINYESAKAEIQLGLHAMASSENQEQNLVDQYEQMRITAIARSTGGAIPNVSGAFRTVSGIAQDSLSRSTAGLNSALGAFGNVVGNITNKYFSSNNRVVNQTTNVNNTTNVEQNQLTSSPLPQREPLRQIPLVEGSDISALSDPTN